MIGLIDENFIQPAQGQFVSIRLQSCSGLVITLGFIQVGTAGIYNIVEIRTRPDRSHSVAAIRLNSGILGETEPGALIRKGEVVRSLTLNQVRSLIPENQSRPHGPLPDCQGVIDRWYRWSSSLAAGSEDVGEPYIYPYVCPSTTIRDNQRLHSLTDSDYWRGECDRLVRELIRSTPDLRVDEADAPTQLIDLAILDYELTHFELAQSLQRSRPFIDLRVADRGDFAELRGRIRFRLPTYHTSPGAAGIGRIEAVSSSTGVGSIRAILEGATSFVMHHPGKSEIPQGCRGCSNLHGKAYTGEHGRNMFICAMHPGGYEGEGQCPDKQ